MSTPVDQRKHVFRVNLGNLIERRKQQAERTGSPVPTLKSIADELGWNASQYQWLRRIYSAGLSHVSESKAKDLDDLLSLLGVWPNDRPNGMWHENGLWGMGDAKDFRVFKIFELAALGAWAASRHPRETRTAETILRSAVSTEVKRYEAYFNECLGISSAEPVQQREGELRNPAARREREIAKSVQEYRYRQKQCELDKIAADRYCKEMGLVMVPATGDAFQKLE